jgi:hypothetical protein
MLMKAVVADQSHGLGTDLLEDLPVDRLGTAALLGDQQEIARRQQPRSG